MLGLLKQCSFARLLVMVAFLSLVGCATQLAPPYDKSIAEGLSAANTEAMTLLAAASQGTDKSTFSSREDKYNNLIGKLDAMALSAAARPMQKNKVTEAINKLLEKRSGKHIDFDDSTPPSSNAMRKIAETLTVMRNKDKNKGLQDIEVQAFKGQIIIYLDQAITYENFLQR